MKRRWIGVAAMLAAAFCLVSCKQWMGQGGRGAVDEGMMAMRAAPATAPPPPAMMREMAAPAGAAAATEAQGSSNVPALAERKLMRTATLEIEVGDLNNARARTEQVVAGAGGFVTDANAYEDNAGQKSLVLSLRVPAAKLDEALAAIKSIGRVKEERVGAEDVTEQYIDLEARLANAKKLEERLLALLETKTTKLKDLLDTERELARVRTDIETMLGHKRFLDNRISLSTINVTFSEPRGFGRGIFAPLAGLFQHALEAFTGSLAALIVVVAGLLPWTVLVLIVCWIVIRIVRRRRRRRAAAAAIAMKKEGQ